MINSFGFIDHDEDMHKPRFNHNSEKWYRCETHPEIRNGICGGFWFGGYIQFGDRNHGIEVDRVSVLQGSTGRWLCEKCLIKALALIQESKEE